MARLNQSAVASLGSPPIPALSIRGNRLTLKDAEGQEMTLPNLYVDVVFIDFNDHMSRMYWPEGYDETKPTPPSCWSDNGIGPSINATVPQSLSGKCADCQHNQFTTPSKKGDGKTMTKACGSKKKTAVLVVDLPVKTPFQFILPWAAHKKFKEYATEVGAWRDPEQGITDENPLSLADVITRVSLPGPKDGLGTLQFETVDYVNTELVADTEAALDAKLTRLLCGLDDQPRQAALPAPQGNGGIHVTQTAAPSPAPAQGIHVPTAPIQLPQSTPALAGLHQNAAPDHQAQLEAERAALQAEREALAAERAAMQAGAQQPATAVEGELAKKPRERPPRAAKGAPPPEGAPVAPRQPTFGAGSTTAITPGSPVGDQVRSRISGLFKPKN